MPERLLRLETLEDRRLLALGDLIHTFASPVSQPGALFGCAVAVSGSTLVVGAEADGAGSAHVLDAAGGTLLRSLGNPAPSDTASFGASVAVSGSTVVVGAPESSPGGSNAGWVYVYDAGSGALLRTLNNPAPDADDSFGSAVAVSGSTVVVGTPYDDTGATDAGSVYVFDAGSGALLATLHNPSPTDTALFGSAVAIAGNKIVVGAPVAGSGSPGLAYVFNATSGALLSTLNSSNPTLLGLFGQSVAIAGNTVVVGAPNDNADGSGAAYVFDAASGAPLATLANPAPASTHGFGFSVAVSGRSVVITSPYDQTGMPRSGPAYLVDALNGTLLAALSDPAPAASYDFGCSAAADGGRAVVGADGGSDQGSAYLFNALHTPGTPDLVADYDTGSSTGDHLTKLDNSDGTKRLAFNVPDTQAGTTVGIWADGTQIGSAVAAADGVTLVTTNGTYDLADGSHAITARETVSGVPSLDSTALAVQIDTAAPTADVVDVAPDPRSTSVAGIRVVFDAAVTGFDRADLALTHDGGSDLLAGSAAALTSGDGGVTWSLAGLDSLTATAGKYQLTLAAATSGVTDLAGNALQADAADSWSLASSVADRLVFYNNCRWDASPGHTTGDPAINAYDDNAIANGSDIYGHGTPAGEDQELTKQLGKTALLPGQKATFANYTSYAKGLNGIMIDFDDLPGPVTADDFIFRVGNSDTPDAWSLAPAPLDVQVRYDVGPNHVDRVTLIWADHDPTKTTLEPGAIANEWLQITVRPTAGTNYAADVFYFGNAVGEAGNLPTNNAQVTSADELGDRHHQHTPGSPAGLYDPYDFNRDKQVNAADQLISRHNRTTPSTALSLIKVPGGVTVTASGGSTDVTEGGATDTYTIVLNSAPTAAVTVLLIVDSQVQAVDQAHPGNAYLTFTTSNWSVAQTVLVTAVDDTLLEGPHAGQVAHVLQSTDANYNDTARQSVLTANVTDNDDSDSDAAAHDAALAALDAESGLSSDLVADSLLRAKQRKRALV